MQRSVLRALGGQSPNSLFKINFAPSHAADFRAPLAGQNERLDDLAEDAVKAVGGLSDPSQFIVAEIPRHFASL
jgi:hypothetical protein